MTLVAFGDVGVVLSVVRMSIRLEKLKSRKFSSKIELLSDLSSVLLIRIYVKVMDLVLNVLFHVEDFEGQFHKWYFL